MRAVILAGGEGTRLRPISAECPKPMVRLLDKPVMEYGVELLRKHGVTELYVTLQTMPQKIIDHFGDGSALGVFMRYNVEKEPLGTAGGAAAALRQGEENNPLPDEPVFILSGDAVTDFNLRAALDFHNAKKADATLVLTRRPNVLEYGLVMTDGEGRVTRFIEKPAWGQVFTDMVNTGIYILSSAALNRIPAGTAFDFSRDLFPLMLNEGMGLYGFTSEGYWCDIGDCGAYLQCCRDILDGHVRLTPPMQPPLPVHAAVTQPCYVGADVHFGKDVRIGPYAVIGAGSRLGDRVTVGGGVLDGAVMEAGSSCGSAFIGRGTVLLEGASVKDGAVIGENAIIGENAEVLESARVWPRREIPASSRVSGSVSRGTALRAALFDSDGIISGLPHVDVTPDFCLRLGYAAAQTARSEVSLSWQGGEAARVCALALETGVSAGGARAVITDALTPFCAAFAGQTYNIPLNVFIKQEGRLVTMYFYGRDGLTPGRAVERKLEATVLRGDIALTDPHSVRPPRSLSGIAGAYAAAAAASPPWAAGGFSPVYASVAGGGTEADLLRRALTAAGCVSGTRSGGPVLTINNQALCAEFEDGRKADHTRMLGMLIHTEAACGTSQLAMPYDAPAFLDDVAARLGVRILRTERDGVQARLLLADQPFIRDPVFMAARLIHGCRKLKTTLSRLEGRLPVFYLMSGEVPVGTDRSAVMRELVRQSPGAELYEGLRARTRGGWVRVSPLPNRRALRIVAEGVSAELADEICVEFMQKIRMLGENKN